MTYSSLPPQLDNSWGKILEAEFQKPYMATLKEFIKQERSNPNPIYPPARDVFNAFSLTPFDQVKVVIIGQDPYHGMGQAHGLCFSVQPRVAVPPSLQNIFLELHHDLGIPIPSHGCLSEWAKQGVLLLNATLTVRQGSPLSHHGKGWEIFTDSVIRILSEKKDPIAFLLWGKSAKQKCLHLVSTNQSKLVLTASHPSPYSADFGFFGCRHFSKTNQFLLQHGLSPIDWNLK